MMTRERIGELMDDPALDHAAHRHALRSLNRVNALFGVDRRVLRAVADLGGAEASVLDIGSGGGGFLSRAARLAPGAKLIGLDISRVALRFAQSAAPPCVHFVIGDARRLPMRSSSVDVATCSLFLHHFDPHDVRAILAEMARVARRGVVVCDLHRSWFALMLTWCGARLLSRSRVFHTDGVRSVRAAYRPQELLRLAEEAGLRQARATGCAPLRYILTWRKESAHAA